MQKLYLETNKLDASCRASYGLSEEVMMENAAMALESAVRNPCPISKDRRQPQKVLIICGGGNNGADGYTLSRRLRFDYDVSIIQFFEPKSDLCKIQAERAEKCGVRFVKREDLSFYDLRYSDIIVDCVFGSGFHGDLDEKTRDSLNDMNLCECFKISCDVPTGLREDGTVAEGAFAADLTVTMGALKTCLYSDCAKDYAGEIKCAELGLNRRLYENSTNSSTVVGMLLEEKDLVLPNRTLCNVNKGSFGHVVIASGEKTGAACIAGSSALRFGAGLVTLVYKHGHKKTTQIPAELMTSSEFPEKVNAIAFGMGLGLNDEYSQTYFDFILEHQSIKCVIDADSCYAAGLKSFLEKKEKGVVLTPHPKEFQAILKNCDLGDYSVEEVVVRRLELVEKFCRKFPKKLLLLKGANPVIGYFDGFKYKMFINPFGRPCLAKAGSGDVLSGMIASLLAQHRKSIDAAITASLAHALASRKIKCDYAMTPYDLIAATGEL
ncbi:NAD(P)H-hydrate dehydratase [Treponema sp.]|uniref:NAD(P)H-hydrate dehydratase n=1 Tax=Treponema sp. TaxID=166 RepID=UPI003890EA32